MYVIPRIGPLSVYTKVYMKMKKLPIGIQNIKEILLEGQLYVDKTGLIKDLIDSGKYFFMSRPRRFGKSLFLSTLEQIFSGNKELFKEQAIYQSDYNWEEHPILYLDFSRLMHPSAEDLTKSLLEALVKQAKAHGISIEGSSVQITLEALIEGLAKRNRVVVLIDEYDYPMINQLKNPSVAEGNRDILKGFYATLKSLDRYIRFTFVTGISKFSQVSLFSGPNNLTDITMNPKYATLMGYTEDEIHTYCQAHLQEVAKERNQTVDQTLKEIANWYNGYRFTEAELSVYNPYSTLRYLSEKKPKSFWYSTGTPSFLIDQVRKHPESALPLREAVSDESQLSDISRLDEIDLVALMFQTGYLTISGYDTHQDYFSLDFPNEEVKQAFFSSLIKDFGGINPVEISRDAKELFKEFETLQLEAFFDRINHQLAKAPYQLLAEAKESVYHLLLYIILEKSGFDLLAEVATSVGRIDLVITLKDRICILELKLDQSPDVALAQIESKQYCSRYIHQKKEILALGVSFSSKSRSIQSWKGELFSESGEKLKRVFKKSFR